MIMLRLKGLRNLLLIFFNFCIDMCNNYHRIEIKPSIVTKPLFDQLPEASEHRYLVRLSDSESFTSLDLFVHAGLR